MALSQRGTSQTASYTAPKIGDPCQACRKRPSTLWWVGDGGALAYSHGAKELRCDICAFEAQLEYARNRAADIPELEYKLDQALLADKVKPEEVIRRLVEWIETNCEGVQVFEETGMVVS